MDDNTAPLMNKPWWILAAVALVCFMINIDFTAINLALLQISAAVHSRLEMTQWILSGYVLIWGATVVAAGRFADTFGPRRLFLYGISLFIIGSVLCSLSNYIWQLIAGRLIQGVGAAIFLPAAYSLTFRSFSAAKRGVAVGVISFGVGLGLALGPSIGGIVLTLLSWRWIFLLDVPFGVIAWIIIFCCAKKEAARISGRKLDLKGMALLTTAYLLLILGLTHVELWHRYSDTFAVIMYLGMVSIVFFIINQGDNPRALLPNTMLANRNYIGSCLGFMCLQFNFAAIFMLMSLMLQNMLGYSSYQSGFIFLAMTMVWACLSPFGGFLQDKVNVKLPIILGLVAFIAAMLTLDNSSHHLPLAVIIIVFIMMGLAFGLAYPGFNAIMLRSVKAQWINTASGFFTMLSMIGATLGVVFSTVLLLNQTQNYFFKLLDKQHIVLTTIQQYHLQNMIEHTHYNIQGLANFSPLMQQKIYHLLILSYAHGLHDAFTLNMVVAILGLLFCLVLVKFKRNAVNAEEHCPPLISSSS